MRFDRPKSIFVIVMITIIISGFYFLLKPKDLIKEIGNFRNDYQQNIKIDSIDNELKQKKNNFKRLAILTINTPPFYPKWSKIAVKNRKRYAQKHGYGLYIEHGLSDTRSPVWSKIAALLQHMEEDTHEWYWALDLDALLMNGEKEATIFLDDKYDLIVNNDCNWFNAGSFFIKNSEWSKEYLRKVLAVQKPDPEFFEEQAAMINVKNQDASNNAHFKYIPQKDINAYRDYPSFCSKSEESKFPIYSPGDLLVHFPGHSKWDGFPDMLRDWDSNATGLDLEPV